MRRHNNYKRCSKCLINKCYCFCEHFLSIDSKTKFSLIIHKKETLLPSNSGRLFLKQFTNSDEYIRGDREAQVLALDRDYIPLYLYPDDESVLLDTALLEEINKPIQLIIPDCTWSQAKRIKRRTPALNNVQSIHLPHNLRSKYLLRKKEELDYLCTYEAMMYAYSIIERNDKHLEQLKVLFEHFVSATMRLRLNDNDQYKKLMQEYDLLIKPRLY